MLLGLCNAQSEVGASPAPRCCALSLRAGAWQVLGKGANLCSRLEVKAVQEDQRKIQRVSGNGGKIPTSMGRAT